MDAAAYIITSAPDLKRLTGIVMPEGAKFRAELSADGSSVEIWEQQASPGAGRHRHYFGSCDRDRQVRFEELELDTFVEGDEA